MAATVELRSQVSPTDAGAAVSTTPAQHDTAPSSVPLAHSLDLPISNSNPFPPSPFSIPPVANPALAPPAPPSPLQSRGVAAYRIDLVARGDPPPLLDLVLFKLAGGLPPIVPTRDWRTSREGGIPEREKRARRWSLTTAPTGPPFRRWTRVQPTPPPAPPPAPTPVPAQPHPDTPGAVVDTAMGDAQAPGDGDASSGAHEAHTARDTATATATTTAAETETEAYTDTTDPHEAFARFDVHVDMMRYSDEEYEMYLKDPSWTRAETDYLWHLCSLYELRWFVIADRWEWKGEAEVEVKGEGVGMVVEEGDGGGKEVKVEEGMEQGKQDSGADGKDGKEGTEDKEGKDGKDGKDGKEGEGRGRGVDDLKSRYYSICSKLLSHRPHDPADPAYVELLQAHTFPYARELARKRHVAQLLGRTADQVKEEELLVVELRRKEANDRRWDRERAAAKGVFAKLDAASMQERAAIIAGPLAMQGGQAGVGMDPKRSKKRREDGSLVNGGQPGLPPPGGGGTGVGGGGGGASGYPYGASSAFRDRAHASLAAITLDAQTPLRTQRLNAGTTLQSSRMSQVKTTVMQKVQQVMQDEFGV
ncbi:swr complex subunit, partial [Gonapodya sp. JEL0774]